MTLTALHARRQIGRRPDPEVAPLSFGQERLWVLHQLAPHADALHHLLALEIHGELNVAALQQALNFVVQRHESLRTAFVDRSGQTCQRIHERVSVDIGLVDLRGARCPDRTQAIHRIAVVHNKRPFDLTDVPLLRATLCVSERGESVLLLTQHHITTDGWSINVLLRDLVAAYQAFTEGGSAPLPRLRFQHGDFSHWQRERLRDAGFDKLRSYWEKKLAAIPATFAFPADAPGTTGDRDRTERVTCEFDARLLHALEARAARHGATLFIMLLAVFKVALHRWTGSADLIVCSDLADRSIPGTEDMIGFLLNRVVLRTSCHPDWTFSEFLSRVRETVLEAFDHQELPFQLLVNSSKVEVDRGDQPFSRIAFTVQRNMHEEIKLRRLKLRQLRVPTNAAHDFLLSIKETAVGATAVLEYQTKDHSRTMMLRFLASYRRIAAQMADDPERKIGAISMLTDEGAHQLAVEWNETLYTRVTAESIHDQLAAHAKEHPDRIAVRRGASQITYHALNSQADQLARELQALKVSEESLVGICLDRSPRMIEGILAVLKSGGAYVALDPTYPDERLAYMMDDARVSVVLTDRQRTDRVRTIAAQSGIGVPIVQLDAEPALKSSQPPIVVSDVQPGNLAYVMYTSGSTGRPKGVGIAHQGVATLFQWWGREFDAEDVEAVAATMSICFDFSVLEILCTLRIGGTIILAQSPLELPDLEGRESLTMICGIPSVIGELLRVDQMPPNLRVCHFGAEPLPDSLVPAIYSRTTVRRAYNLYGPTEDTVSCAALRTAESKHGVGRSLSGKGCYVLDQQMSLVPIGVRADLYLAGKGLARGYLRRARETAASFIPDPLATAPGARMYRSGDLACRLPDGNLEILGRSNRQVKVRGYRVELEEVELALARLEGVREAAVIATDDHGAGKRLVACLAVDAASDGIVARLRRSLAEVLPGFMLPSRYVVLSSLPRLPNGKIDRGRLSNQVEIVSQDSGPPERTPRGTREQVLEAIWRAVLKRPFVGRDDNFFEIGGDSIVAIQVISRVNEAGLKIEVNQFFKYPTIAGLAAACTPSGAEDGPGAESLDPAELTPIQSWFFACDRPNPHYFNQSVTLRLSRHRHPSNIATAVRCLYSQHDALWSRFVQTSEGWRQIWIPPPPAEEIAVVDLSDLEAERRRVAYATVATAINSSLHLQQGPIARFVLVQFEAQTPERLLVVVHHLAVDGVSWRILFDDLHRIMQCQEQGRPVESPRKTASCRQWSDGLKKHVDSGRVDAERAFWKTMVTARPPRIPLDFGDRAVDNREGSCENVVESLDAVQTASVLRRIPQIYGVTPEETLLAAAAIALSRWAGTAEVFIDLERHGRDLPSLPMDMTRTVGWFTSLFPVLLRLPAQRSAEMMLLAIKDQVRSIPAGGIGYGLLKYIGKHDADLPQPEVAFNYQGRIDLATRDESGFEILRTFSGQMRDGRDQRAHVLEINAAVFADAIHVTWCYSRQLHQAATIRRLAQAMRGVIRELAEHRGPAGRRRTPSDFSLIALTQEQIDSVSQEVGEIEDVYPLSPLQEGILFHSLYSAKSRAYLVQMGCVLTGDLNVSALEQSWNLAMARHPALRTTFHYRGLPEPVQVVASRAEAGFRRVDLLHVPVERQRPLVDSILEGDRARPCDLCRAPLMRFTIIRTDARRHHLCWTHHHLLTDGWSVAQVVAEVFESYRILTQGGQLRPPPVKPFRDFICWLRQRDKGAAERYWQSHLLPGASTLPRRLAGAKSAAVPSGRGGTRREINRALPAGVMNALKAWATANRLTVTTLLYGTWAILLRQTGSLRQTGESEPVTFGITVSGRPSEMPGVEHMVGLFINTLPLTVHVPSTGSVSEWLCALQTQQIRLWDFQHVSLAEIQRAVRHLVRPPLFDSIVTVENFPKIPLGNQAFGISEQFYSVDEQYPIIVDLAPRAELSLRVKYDSARFEERAVRETIEEFCTVISALVDGKSLTFDSLRGMLHDAPKSRSANWPQSDS